MSFMPKTWNDILAIALIVGLPLYWWLAVPNEMVTGATIAGFTLCVQFYFRKSPGGDDPTGTVPHG